MKEGVHKATINFPTEVWARLSSLSAMQGTSNTAIILSLLIPYIDDKLPDNYEERIKERVNRTLDSKIDEAMVKAIARQVIILMNSTDSSDPLWKPVIEGKGATVDVSSSEDEKPSTDNTGDTDNTVDTDGTDDNKAEKTIRTNIANNGVLKVLPATINRTGVSDIVVAEKEGLSKTTVNHYRTGRRKPPQDFCDRWAVNWNKKKWIEN